MINPAPVLYQTLPAMINLAPVLNLTIVAMINSAPVLCYQNSTSNTKVPQICLSSRASWLSAMITLAPIGRAGRLPGSKHLEPDCVRQQTRRSWDSVLVISTAGTRLQALGYSFLSRWPMKVVGGLVCWLLCRCWARWAMLILVQLCIVHCLIHNIVAGCAVGPPGDKTVAQKGHLPWDSSFWPRHPKYREGPPSKIRWWEAPFWVSSFFLRLTTSVYSRSSCNK